MFKKNSFFLVLLSLSALLLAPAAFASSFTAKSRNGKIELHIYDKAGGPLFYSIKYEGKTIIEPSRLNLKFKGLPEIKRYNSFDGRNTGNRTTWEYPWGRQRVYHDNYTEEIITLQEKPGSGKIFRVIFRIYDDGIAFRYMIDKETVSADEYVLEEDLTEFNFPNSPTAWMADLEKFQLTAERPFTKGKLTTLPTDARIGCPLVIQTNEKGPYIALTETELNHWGGLYFAGQENPDTKILFDSQTVNAGEKAKPFNVSVAGVQRLELLVRDGGDRNTSDHADWCDPMLTTNDGTKVALSTLKPTYSQQDWGAVHTDRSTINNPLRVGGQEYKTGFGMHASGKIVFELDGKYKSLEGFVGMDDEESGKGSAQFLIKTTTPTTDKAKLRAVIAPRLDGNGLAAVKTPDASPWRVIIIAPDAISLVDQTIVMNLSRPTAEGDWSWVKPGIATWEWWNGSVRMSTETLKPYIDFAAEMGFPYHLVDAPWYSSRRTDTEPAREDLLKGSNVTDMAEVVRYAKEKNVRLWLWLHWTDIDKQMDEAFAQYEKWGIAGVKIDFMDRDDQEMVEWYDKTVQKAAKHKLMVNFHGAYKPTGYRRTYPNLITREGIFGNEQNKWTRMTAEHYCTLPFTRLMLGPGDFTPGAFLNRNFPGEPIPGYNTAQGIGTRAHELAISMLYDSPLLCLCDRPEYYRGDPSFEFYRDLPTVWDESHGVEGEIGEYFSMWRRNGDDFYYGAITNETQRNLTLPLTFLGEGNYEATVYADTEETKTDGRKIQIETKTVTKQDTLSVNMVSGGGQAIVFKRVK